MSTSELVDFLRSLKPSAYMFGDQVRTGMLELSKKDVDEIIITGGLAVTVDVLMSNINDGPLHMLGFKLLLKLTNKYSHLVKLSGADQVAEQVMQLHDDNVVELGDQLIKLLSTKKVKQPKQVADTQLMKDFHQLCKETKTLQEENNRLKSL